LTKFNYGILVSGALGLKCLDFLYNFSRVSFVLTDTKSLSIVEYCIKNNIPHFIGNPRNGKGLVFIKDYVVDVILSINYLFIIDSDLIRSARKYAINFHGSLLPKYRGRTPHVWSIINNEKETGITAHVITEECDKGGIVYQEKIQISPDTTGGILSEHFFTLYPLIIKKVVSMIENDQIVLVEQDETMATWFGKRTPEDGEINWNWQKERIYNWVRAQSNPYPGAFTYYKNSKVIIHKIEYSDMGFNFEQENGTILLGGSRPIIKTPNGAVKLATIETPTSIIFNKDEKLHERH
jgi:methionyl-tRNA formyltransferase